MNRLEGKSLDNEIKRYAEQMMSRYAQSSQSTPPPPQPVPERSNSGVMPPPPMPKPEPAPELEAESEFEPEPMPQPAPQRPNTGVTPAAPQRPNTDVTSAAPQRPNTGVTPAAPQRPNTGVTSAEADYQRFVAQNPQRGILRVQTLTARGTYPVPGVKVVVSKIFPSGEHTIATQETDNAGKTEGLLLPAPDRSLSEQPGNGSRPFADYKLTIIHPDFATIVALQVPVFASESSLQVLNLIPLSAAPHGSSTIEYITTEPSDL